MTASLIDGRAVAAELRARIRDEATASGRRRPAPGLVVVLVGNNPASEVYVRSKPRQTIEAGMLSFEHRLPVETSQEELVRLVGSLNADPTIDGILVQLPLPAHIDANIVLNALDPTKDVDGFHPLNAGRLATGDKQAMTPCTPLGAIHLLKSVRSDLGGAHAVVLERSNIVGKPVGQLLLAENCTVTVAHSRTRDLAQLCRNADIIVAALGRPELIRGDWIREGAIVIDVGINRIRWVTGIAWWGTWPLPRRENGPARSRPCLEASGR